MTNDEDMEDLELCPSCGAPRENLAEAKCSYCGARLHVQEPAPVHQPYLGALAGLCRDYAWKDYRAWYIIGAVCTGVFFILPWYLSSRAGTFSSESTAPNSPPAPEPTSFVGYVSHLARSGRDSDMLLTTAKKELALVNAQTSGDPLEERTLPRVSR